MRTRTLALGALCAFALTAQSPEPSPSTLPEIGRVRARGLCTTVRDSVAPIVLGLMKSDELIGAGHRAFLKISDDMRRTGPGPAVDLDQVYLQRASDGMAHNLGVIDKFLADQKRFPKTATTDDERIALQLKEQIAAVVAQQRKTLDVLNGALDSEALGRMQNEFPGGIAGSTAPDRIPKGVVINKERGPDANGTFIGAAGLNMPTGTPTFDPRTLGASKTGPHSVWDSLAGVVGVQQGAIAAAEQRLSPTVVAVSIACREELKSPAPRASP